MPIIKSAIKRSRQNTVRRQRLRPVFNYMKTMMKKVTDLAKTDKKEEVAKLLPGVYKAIDMAAKKNIIHSKNADRKKSRMARLLKV